MKFKLLIIVSLFSFLIFVPFVSAEARVNTLGEASNREEAKTNIKNKKEEIKLKITAVKKERIMSHFVKMEIRIQAIIERIQKLIDNIDARIVKIDASSTENKIDTTLAKKDLAEANAKLFEVKALTNNLSIDETLSSETPKEAFVGVREDVKLIKTGLKEVHSLLVKIIGDLKGLRIGSINEK